MRLVYLSSLSMSLALPILGGCNKTQTSSGPIAISESQFGEKDLPFKGGAFRPLMSGKEVKVILFLKDPYEFEVDSPGAYHVTPQCRLQVLKDSLAVTQTNEVKSNIIPIPPVPPPEGDRKMERCKRLRCFVQCWMEVKFTPGDTESYQIAFEGEKRGFRRYVLQVEQQR